MNPMITLGLAAASNAVDVMSIPHYRIGNPGDAAIRAARKRKTRLEKKARSTARRLARTRGRKVR